MRTVRRLLYRDIAGAVGFVTLAFLSEPDIHPGVDRVVAVFGDGRAYAWHQLNGSLAE